MWKSEMPACPFLPSDWGGFAREGEVVLQPVSWFCGRTPLSGVWASLPKAGPSAGHGVAQPCGLEGPRWAST